MGKVTGSYFENPYLEEGEHTPSVELVMDEARQKWRTGSWKPKEGSFEIRRDKLAGPVSRKNAPSSDRFKLDLKKDLMGEGISLESLSELSYTPSYRPKGRLEKLNEDTFVPMSTLQRYDVLAGELEAPPKDISFLSDAQRKQSRTAGGEDGSRKDGKLRNDTRRLEQSVDARRSEILRMLPSADSDDTKKIIDESKRRKAREDKELGKPVAADNSENERYSQLARMARDFKKKKRAYLDGIDTTPDNDLIDLVRAEGERMQRLPEQDGMNAGTRELPKFESQTRYWSRIDSLKPTWSEVAENTVSSSPNDEDRDHEPRYIDEDLFDERAPYKEILPPRKRLRSKEAGSYDSEYIREAGVDPERVREILDKEYRGRWVPPEFFADNELVNDWFNQYNRGALSGEDYMHWAYRQKIMEQQQQAEANEEFERQQAERKPAYHSDTSGRRYPPFSRGGSIPPMRAPRDEQAYEAARREGYRRGVEIDRLSREHERREERRGRYDRRGGPVYGRGGYDRPYSGYGRYDGRYDRRDSGYYGMPPEGYGRPRPRYYPEDEDERGRRGRREQPGADYPHRRRNW